MSTNPFYPIDRNIWDLTKPEHLYESPAIFSEEHEVAAHPDSGFRRIDLEHLKECGLLPWIQEAVRRGASDLFLSDAEVPTLKVAGSFLHLPSRNLTAETMARIIEAILPPAKLKDYQQGKEVDLGLDVPQCTRLRLNVFRHMTGTTLAIRPLSYRIPDFDELGLPAVFEDLVHLKRGLVLITGPAGSGKSTTLASFIQRINRFDERHIITIEDPIEYVIPSERSLIHQREVGCHTAGFTDGLKNALRENPDVIVVGELRDLDSIMLSIRAAETGHLVLGTLHSGSAVQALTRLLDVFDSTRQALLRVQLAQSLQAVCAQRLYPRADGTGMVLATEVLVATLAIRNIIRDQRLQEIRGYMETGMREQMHTMAQSIKQLVNAQLIAQSYLYENTEEHPVPELSDIGKFRIR